MKAKEETTKEFLQELKALLCKYDAEIRSEDHWQGYPECGEDVRMTVYVHGKYTENYSECLREYTEIDLGGFIDGK